LKTPPTQQLDELKPFLFVYVIMAPLVSALFAEKIDNTFVACLLFIVLVGACFVHLRNRLQTLEESLKEQEQRLTELVADSSEEQE
jgi:hypothetical protein